MDSIDYIVDWNVSDKVKILNGGGNVVGNEKKKKKKVRRLRFFLFIEEKVDGYLR